MCHSTTRLSYGIIIKAWSLYIASLAFQRLIPVSLALDIIMMRSRSGSLEMVAEDGTKRNDLSIVVWEMIRKEVIELEIVIAETKELERVCPGCTQCGYHREGDERLKARGEEGKTFYSQNGYWSNSHEVSEEEDELKHPSDQRTRIMDAFLLSVGMEFNLAATDKFTPLYTIALQSTTRTESLLQPDQNNVNRAACGLDIDHPSFDNNVSSAFIDPSIFTSINCDDALSRFKRLVNDYHLDLDDSTNQECPTFTSHSSGTISADTEATEERKKEVIRKLKKHVVQPRWIVSAHITSCM